MTEVTRGLVSADNVYQAVSAGGDGFARGFLATHVDHRQLASLVSGVDKSFHELDGCIGQDATTIVEDLNVVRPLGDPRIDKGLSLVGRADGRKLRATHVGGETAGDGRANAGAADVGDVWRIFGGDC